MFEFYSLLYLPTNKKLRSRRIRKLRRVHNENDTLDAKIKTSKRFIDKIQYGHTVPCNWKDIICIDARNENSAWQDAVAKEVAALIDLGCFDVKSPNFKPPDDYQFVQMH